MGRIRGAGWAHVLAAPLSGAQARPLRRQRAEAGSWARRACAVSALASACVHVHATVPGSLRRLSGLRRHMTNQAAAIRRHGAGTGRYANAWLDN